MSVIVRGYRDRIQRGGGSVVVSATGLIDINVPSGQTGRLQHNGVNRLYWDSSKVTVPVALDVSSTLTVSGPGTHTFAGPIKVSSLITSDRAADFAWFDGLQTGARRFRIHGASNADAVFFAYTGTAGSEAGAEALRIVNANAYVSVATRLGVGTASPSYTAHVVGSSYLNGSLGVAVAPDTAAARLLVEHSTASASVAKFTQTAANATAPVLVVKCGSSPGTGGDIAQFQDATSTAVAAINSSGYLQLNGPSSGGFGGQIEIAGRTAAAPGSPSAGRARLWYDDTAKAFKYKDSAGTVRTITAA